MRLVLEGRGRLTIDVFPSVRPPDPNPQPPTRPAASIERDDTWPGIDPNDRRCPEEVLFTSLLFLLRRHHERVGGKPTGKVLSAAANTLTELCERGHPPEPHPSDTLFLAQLMAVLDQLRERATSQFLIDLTDAIRELLLDEEPPTRHHNDDADDATPPDGGPSEPDGGTPSGDTEGGDGRNGAGTA